MNETEMNQAWEDLKKAELGQPYEGPSLREFCDPFYGAVAWPGKERPGFVVVVAASRVVKCLGEPEICLSEEFESFDTRELVRQCGALHHQYRTDKWIGNTDNDAAYKFMREMNDEFDPLPNERFNLTPTQMVDMKTLYPYILGELKKLLRQDRRLLCLRDSKILSHLSGIEGSEIATLELGDYPAIEALAFAVISLRRSQYEDQFYEPVDEEPDLLSLGGLGIDLTGGW